MNYKIKNKIYILGTIIFTIACLGRCKKDDFTISFEPNPSSAYLTPKESMNKTFLQDGYKLELVASEPDIQEPVLITWDGNGRMYVAEMVTYMQDADATSEQLPISRIKILEDTNNDGEMDKITVFVDSLLLPRMMICIGNELWVNETNSITIKSYKDIDGDGTADVEKVIYQNDSYVVNDVNMEHQRSGLDWNLDNWMYMTYEPIRLRYKKEGRLEIDTLTSGGNGQWGITHDNYGRLYFSRAGAEIPALGFQINPAYGKLDFIDNYDLDFPKVWPIVATPDVQGGRKRLRANNTLNHFTSSCGQSIYRGDALGGDLIGDYIICEPVGRIIRRAKIEHYLGKATLKNAYREKEFIASQDLNFRPVYTATGPDGCLYIVDMYRGIIQQANWTKPGSFIRHKIDSLDLAQNVGRGRIYKVVKDEVKSSEQPNMLNESSRNLIRHLGHPNGWWRDNAQRLIIIRGDDSVTPELSKIALNQEEEMKDNQLARIHAIWTLEGLNSLSQEIIFKLLNDNDHEIRKTAIWASEPWLETDDTSFIAEVAKLKNDSSFDVKVQILLSMSQSDHEDAKSTVNYIVNNNKNNEMIQAVKLSLDRNQSDADLLSKLNKYMYRDKQRLLTGASIFRTTCSSCHGDDGSGLKDFSGTNTTPSLFKSRFVKQDESENLIKILLWGLEGSVDGNSYSGDMPAMGANNDWWISSIASFVRFEFGNIHDSSVIVLNNQVKDIREKYFDRNRPWKENELLDYR